MLVGDAEAKVRPEETFYGPVDFMPTPGELEVAGRDSQVTVKLARNILCISNGVIFLAALAGTVVAVAEKGRMKESLAVVCTGCTRRYTGFAVVYGLLAVLSLLGFHPLLSRQWYMRVVFGIYLAVVLILFFALLIIGLYPLVVMENRWEDIIWSDAAALAQQQQQQADGSGPADPFQSRLCQVQLDYRCSGWFHRCDNREPYDVNTSRTRVCPICAPEDQNQFPTFRSTCSTIEDNVMIEYYTTLFPISLVVLCFLSFSLICSLFLSRHLARGRGGRGFSSSSLVGGGGGLEEQGVHMEMLQRVNTTPVVGIVTGEQPPPSVLDVITAAAATTLATRPLQKPFTFTQIPSVEDDEDDGTDPHHTF